ncbi:MAG: hypothetical protein IJH87_04785, partial [Atopobiaceae bacterium]|nr:hypothetical protein [Atopobiaceae bacterium]
PGRIIELNGAPWNKVFRAELLKTMHRLEFPPPVLDDLLFHLLVYPHADRVVFTPHSLVDYLVRSDSIITNIKPEVVPVVYDAFIAVKRYYIGIGAPEELQQALDAVAFLHTSISLMHRLSKSDPAHIDRYVKNNTQFLENFFPTWRKSPYATFGYARPRGLAYMKFLVAHRLYTRGLISTFFKAYSFMIERLGIDIKW